MCIRDRAWSPRAAHQLLRKFKATEIPEIHPMVLACLTKFLSEAVSQNRPAYLVSKKHREDPALKAERQQPIASNEHRVTVDQLTPGMKLSRALKSHDGKEVLASDMELDQDLIWRLWQLSAVRPLNSAVVESDSEV